MSNGTDVLFATHWCVAALAFLNLLMEASAVLISSKFKKNECSIDPAVGGVNKYRNFVIEI
jgi:hypothetical protein